MHAVQCIWYLTLFQVFYIPQFNNVAYEMVGLVAMTGMLVVLGATAHLSVI